MIIEQDDDVTRCRNGGHEDVVSSGSLTAPDRADAEWQLFMEFGGAARTLVLVEERPLVWRFESSWERYV